MLKASTIHRKLDTKFKIGGIEATDLLSVLLCATVMNLFFGRFSLGPIFIFGVSGILFVVLYFGKRGKPEGHLKHLIKFYLSSGKLSAGCIEDLEQ